jgi:DNA-binding NarL/FixJ family response regulator
VATLRHAYGDGVHSSLRDVSGKSVLVGIIEPQRLFAPFLTQLLSEVGFSVVASLESMSLDEIGRNEPDVVFVDIDFVEIDPLTALRQLHGVVPRATICAYTGRGDEGWAAACTAAGANCVISKSATPLEIVSGIQRALEAGTFIDRRFEHTEI